MSALFHRKKKSRCSACRSASARYVLARARMVVTAPGSHVCHGGGKKKKCDGSEKRVDSAAKNIPSEEKMKKKFTVHQKRFFRITERSRKRNHSPREPFSSTTPRKKPEKENEEGREKSWGGRIQKKRERRDGRGALYCCVRFHCGESCGVARPFGTAPPVTFH